MMDYKLIGKHRYINTVYGHWYEWTQQEFADVVAEKYSLKVEKISFSIGFGGYAVFGIGDHFELSDFMVRAKLDAKYPEWVARGGRVEVNIRQGRQLYQSVDISPYYEASKYIDEPGALDPDPFKAEILRVVINQSEETFTDLLNDIEKIIDNLGDELYNMLEAEHEHLTSDEVVWETLVANGMVEDEETEK